MLTHSLGATGLDGDALARKEDLHREVGHRPNEQFGKKSRRVPILGRNAGASPPSWPVMPTARTSSARFILAVAVCGLLAWPSLDASARPAAGSWVQPAADPTDLPESYGLVDTWESEVPTGALLYHPTGIAVDASGRVVVVEAGNGRVTRARTNGQGFLPNSRPDRFGEPGADDGQLEAPEDVAVSADGSRIYVADTGNRRIQVFSSTGDLLGVWDQVGLPRGIALGPGPAGDPDGAPLPDSRVYVADAESHVIRVFTTDGQPIATFGADPTPDASALHTPLGLTIDPQGDLLVADHGHQRVVWLDADASEGPAGAQVGSLPLDNISGPGGAPLDVGVDVTGEVYVAVDRAVLRFRSVESGGSAGGSGRAATLTFSDEVPPVAEKIGLPCDPGQCLPRNPVALGCYFRVAETDSHEGIRRIDLRPEVGLYVTFAPRTRSPDRVIVYPALRGGAPGGITRADDQNVIVWPRQCRDFGGPSLRHTTDPERIAAGGQDPYGPRTLDTSGELHVWQAAGQWYDGRTSYPVSIGLDLAVSRSLPAVTGVVTGNQVRFSSLKCISGGPDDVCPPEKIDVLDSRMLLRRDRTNECRAAPPIPWRPGVPAPCIPDETWWIVAGAADGGTTMGVQRGESGVYAPHDLTVAALNAAEPETILRTLWVEPSGEQVLLSGAVRLTSATAPFESWSDLAYDAHGGLAAVSRSGRVRMTDARGRSRGELTLERLAPRTAESLGIDPAGSLFVLTGDGWVMKFAPEPVASPPSPEPQRALLRAAWRIAELAGPGRYRDLAVDPDGRVLVSDADGDRVLVFAPGSSPAPSPPPAGDACTFVPDKVAAPGQIVIGETTDVTLSLEGECAPPSRDIVVVLDASCQMSGDRLRHARAGLAALADVLTSPAVRLGVVTFNNELGDARLALRMTSDAALVREFAAAFTTDCRVDFACVDARRAEPHIGMFLWPYGCPTEGRIADGLRAGREALLEASDDIADSKTLILVSPSLFDVQRTLAILAENPETFDPPLTPTEVVLWSADRTPLYTIPAQGDRELAMREAWLLRDAGVEVWTVSPGQDTFGAGHPPDKALLAALANPADRFIEAAAATDLPLAFERIAERLAQASGPTTVVVTDAIPANMALVPGSARPPATVVPIGARPDGMLQWVLTVDPEGAPADLSFTLRPLDVGLWPTNVEAAAVFTRPLRTGRVVYPIPYVEVLALPTATPTASPSPTYLPTDQPTPTAPPATGSPSPTEPPSPTPRDTPNPTPRSTLPADPTSTPAIYLPFAEKPGCHRVARPVDIVLVLDTSSSMDGPALAAAKAAAETFVRQLNLRAGADRAALIGFDVTARLAQPLTHNEADLIAAIGGLSTSLGTRIDLGLDAATAELIGARARGGVDRAIVLLTDGRPDGGTEGATRVSAARARAAAGVWAVGLGNDVPVEVLHEITADTSRVYLAPGPGELAAIYRAIASGIVCR